MNANEKFIAKDAHVDEAVASMLALCFGFTNLKGIYAIVPGAPIYTRPSPDYVPYIYPPLYYWISAQAATLLGVDFLAPRLVSFASICAVFALIAAIIRRSGGDWVGALAGAALFAGTYESTERWFHLARVDSLFLALLLGGIYVLQFGTKRSSAIAAGVLLFLAFLSKQTTLIAIAPVLLVAAIKAPQRPAITATRPVREDARALAVITDPTEAATSPTGMR